MTSPLSLVTIDPMPFGFGFPISRQLLAGIRDPKGVLGFSTRDPAASVTELLVAAGLDSVPFGSRAYKRPAKFPSSVLALGPSLFVNFPTHPP